jgi:hypothetical protein
MNENNTTPAPVEPAALPPDVKRGIVQTVRAAFRWALDQLKRIL